MKLTHKILIGAAVVSLVWLAHTPDMSREVLLQKYTNDASQFISNEQGLRVHYRDEGPRDGKVIVLLHGNSTSLHIFEPLAARLVDEYRVVSLDFPGHGLTGAHPNSKYGYAQLGQAVELVTNHLSLENYTLFGHSMGGWVAWRYAVEHPDKLSSLVLMSASGMPPRTDELEQDSGFGFKLLQSPIGPLLSGYTMPRATIEKSTQKKHL